MWQMIFQEEDQLKAFCKQLEDDRKIVISRSNLVELSKVNFPSLQFLLFNFLENDLSTVCV